MVDCADIVFKIDAAFIFFLGKKIGSGHVCLLEAVELVFEVCDVFARKIFFFCKVNYE